MALNDLKLAMVRPDIINNPNLPPDLRRLIYNVMNICSPSPALSAVTLRGGGVADVPSRPSASVVRLEPIGRRSPNHYAVGLNTDGGGIDYDIPSAHGSDDYSSRGMACNDVSFIITPSMLCSLFATVIFHIYP